MCYCVSTGITILCLASCLVVRVPRYLDEQLNVGSLFLHVHADLCEDSISNKKFLVLRLSVLPVSCHDTSFLFHSLAPWAKKSSSVMYKILFILEVKHAVLHYIELYWIYFELFKQQHKPKNFCGRQSHLKVKNFHILLMAAKILKHA